MPTKTQVNRKSKSSINDGYQATYESDPLPEEFVKRHVELYEEQKVLSREEILSRLQAPPIVRLIDGYGEAPEKIVDEREIMHLRLILPATMSLRLLLSELASFLDQQSYLDVGLLG